MVVYRVCGEKEVSKILSGCDYSRLGNNFPVSYNDKNTHKYESGQLYLHFFKDKADILYLKDLKGCYLCSYDISSEILDIYEGVGYYYDLLNYSKLYGILEYAIKSNELSLDYLIQIEYIKDEIDIEDYLDDPSLNDFFDLRYKRDDSKKLIKIK